MDKDNNCVCGDLHSFPDPENGCSCELGYLRDSEGICIPCEGTLTEKNECMCPDGTLLTSTGSCIKCPPRSSVNQNYSSRMGTAGEICVCEEGTQAGFLIKEAIKEMTGLKPRLSFPQTPVSAFLVLDLDQRSMKMESANVQESLLISFQDFKFKCNKSVRQQSQRNFLHERTRCLCNMRWGY